MPNAIFEHTCTECKDTHDVDTPWINPELYTEPEKATKSFTWWCKKCARGQGVRLQLLPEAQVTVVEVLDYNEMTTARSFGGFTPKPKKKKKKHQNLTADAALELLGMIDIEDN